MGTMVCAGVNLACLQVGSANALLLRRLGFGAQQNIARVTLYRAKVVSLHSQNINLRRFLDIRFKFQSSLSVRFSIMGHILSLTPLCPKLCP